MTRFKLLPCKKVSWMESTIKAILGFRVCGSSSNSTRPCFTLLSPKFIF